jgi:excinuclease UvrABC ATPase subunit
VFEGRYADLVHTDTLTAKHLQQALPVKRDVRQPRGKLRIKNARDNNLQNVTVDIPVGVLTLIRKSLKSWSGRPGRTGDVRLGKSHVY